MEPSEIGYVFSQMLIFLFVHLKWGQPSEVLNNVYVHVHVRRCQTKLLNDNFSVHSIHSVQTVKKAIVGHESYMK